jgi:chromate reductase
VLGYLDVPTLGQPEVYIHFSQGLIDEHGNISNETTKNFLQTFMNRYAAWISEYN